MSSERNKPDPKLVKKLQPPKGVKEVESFFGLVNYFGRMIPNYASKKKP